MIRYHLFFWLTHPVTLIVGVLGLIGLNWAFS